MRKLLILFILLAAAVGGVFWLAPMFLPIAEQAEKLQSQLQAEGLTLEYDGTPNASLHDGGSVTLKGLRIYDAKAPAGNPPLLKAASGKAKIDPTTLFANQPKVMALELTEAEIQLPEQNWIEGVAAGNPLYKLLALPLQFQNSSLRLQGKDGEQRIEQLNGKAAIRTTGLAELDLRFRFEGHDWSLMLNWQRPVDGAKGDAELTLKDEHSQLTLEGKLGHHLGQWSGAGHFRFSSTNPWPSLKPIFPLFRQETLANLPAAAFNAEGSYQLSAKGLELGNLQIQSDAAQLSGTITLQQQPALDIRAELKASDWNLDPALAHLDRVISALRAAHTAELAALNLPGWDANSQHVPVLAEDVVAKLTLDSERLHIKGKALENARLVIYHTQGNWILQEAYAKVPGAERLLTFGRLNESGEGWRYKGRVEGNGQALHEVLSWLDIPLPRLPEDQLGAFRGGLVLDWEKNRIQVSEVNLQVDATQLAGTAIYTPAGIQGATLPTLQSSLRLNRIDLDRYFPPSSLTELEKSRAANRESLQATAPQWLHDFPLNFELALAAEEIRYRTLAFSTVQMQLGVMPQRLVLRQLDAVTDQNGLRATGELNSQLRRPKLTLNLTSGGLTLQSLNAFIEGKQQALETTEWRSTSGTAFAWSEAPLDSALWQLFDGDLSVDIGYLTTPKHRFDQIRCQVKGTEGAWQFSGCQSRWLDGQWQWQGSIGAKELFDIKGQLAVAGLQVDRALQTVSSVDSIGGQLSVNAVLETSGATVVQLLQGLKLNSNFVFTPLEVEGFELSTIAQKVLYIRTTADVANLSRLALSGGKTTLNQLQGIAYVKEGVLQIPVSSLQTANTEGHIQCAIDLPRLVMRNELSFKVKSSINSDIPPVAIQWQGSLENPERKLDTRELENFVSNQAIQRQFR